MRPDRLGIMGFSAGGHLASTAGTHFDAGDAAAADPLSRQSSRPDFLVLGYPVVTFVEAWTHKGSRDRLLGDQQHPDLLASLSNEKQVTKETPPTFLFHTDADTGVPPENSVMFYLALRRAGVPAELHIYEQGTSRRRPCAERSRALDLASTPEGLAEGAGVAAVGPRKMGRRARPSVAPTRVRPSP